MPRLVRSLTYVYAIGLLLQGGLTLLARLVPAFDRAVPGLLQVTEMVPAHSLLHIATGLLALYAARRSVHAAWLFLLAFGLFYTMLGLAGALTQQQFGLALQNFDHPIHIVIGIVALGVALLHWLKR
jgi:hypothetical protein